MYTLEHISKIELKWDFQFDYMTKGLEMHKEINEKGDKCFHYNINEYKLLAEAEYQLDNNLIKVLRKTTVVMFF